MPREFRKPREKNQLLKEIVALCKESGKTVSDVSADSGIPLPKIQRMISFNEGNYPTKKFAESLTNVFGKDYSYWKRIIMKSGGQGPVDMNEDDTKTHEKDKPQEVIPDTVSQNDNEFRDAVRKRMRETGKTIADIAEKTEYTMTSVYCMLSLKRYPTDWLCECLQEMFPDENQNFWSDLVIKTGGKAPSKKRNKREHSKAMTKSQKFEKEVEEIVSENPTKNSISRSVITQRKTRYFLMENGEVVSIDDGKFMIAGSLISDSKLLMVRDDDGKYSCHGKIIRNANSRLALGVLDGKGFVRMKGSRTLFAIVCFGEDELTVEGTEGRHLSVKTKDIEKVYDGELKEAEA